jgi:hypothetical protein
MRRQKRIEPYCLLLYILIGTVQYLEGVARPISTSTPKQVGAELPGITDMSGCVMQSQHDEISTGENRWYEKAGLRRDALSSQVIDAL